MLRVVGGKVKGKRLMVFKGGLFRPTTSKVKEAIFDIIGPLLGKEVLDLFAGTGSLGIEALSRQAKRVVFVESNPRACYVLEKNLEGCDLKKNSQIVKGDISRALKILSKKGEVFDLVFLDPPYRKGLLGKTLRDLTRKGILKVNSLVVAEHDSKEVALQSYGDLFLEKQRKYGNTMASFFSFIPSKNS